MHGRKKNPHSSKTSGYIAVNKAVKKGVGELKSALISDVGIDSLEFALLF